MALKRDAWREARATLRKLLAKDEPKLRDDQALRARAFLRQADATMHLPAEIGEHRN